MILHRDLDGPRWWSLSLAEQLAQAGADVTRALRARSAGDTRRCTLAFARALELLDLTLADQRWAGPRRREIARVRELVCDHLVGDSRYGLTSESLVAYFSSFAYASRRNR